MRRVNVAATERRREMLSHIASEMKPLETERARLAWAVATTGDADASRALAALRAKIALAWRERPERETLKAFAADPTGDAESDRGVVLVAREMEERQGDPAALAALAQLETTVQREYTVFRGQIDGKPVSDTEIETMLRSSTDSAERRSAWEASQMVGEAVSAEVLLLVDQRNSLARAMGHRDWYAMRLSHTDIDETELFELLDRLERATREPFTTRKEALDRSLADTYSVSVRDLMPWHYGDPFFQRNADGSTALDTRYASVDLVDAATRFYDGLGMQVRDVLSRSDLEPRAGKSQHAFCTHIDRAGDIRILCNLRPNARWMGTLLHELGHAVYDRYPGKGLGYFVRRPSHTLTTEAIALLMGRQAQDPEFLSAYAGLKSVEAAGLSGELRRRQSMEMLMFTRWVLVMTHFERALYADPKRGDLNTLWWDLKERYQLLHRPPHRDKPDWAAKIHLATAPVYYHNYLLGELYASQLRARLLEDSGITTLVDNYRAGEALIATVFSVGATQSWSTLVASSTGEPLNPRAFTAEFVH
jgi:peptidyl-dipeptidase A